MIKDLYLYVVSAGDYCSNQNFVLTNTKCVRPGDFVAEYNNARHEVRERIGPVVEVRDVVNYMVERMGYGLLGQNCFQTRIHMPDQFHAVEVNRNDFRPMTHQYIVGEP